MEIVINKGDGEDGENGDNGGDAQTRGLHYLNNTGDDGWGGSVNQMLISVVLVVAAPPHTGLVDWGLRVYRSVS